MTAAAPVPICAHNRFPVSLVDPAGAVYARVRVVLTAPDGDRPARLLMWTRPERPRIDVPFDPAASTIGRPRDEWRISTGDGDYLIRPRSGCRCGPLARFEPFNPMVMGTL